MQNIRAAVSQGEMRETETIQKIALTLKFSVKECEIINDLSSISFILEKIILAARKVLKFWLAASCVWNESPKFI